MTARSAEVMASPDKYLGKTVPGALGPWHLHSLHACLYDNASRHRSGQYTSGWPCRLFACLAGVIPCVSHQTLHLLLIEKPSALSPTTQAFWPERAASTLSQNISLTLIYICYLTTCTYIRAWRCASGHEHACVRAVTAEHVSMDDCATAISKVTGQTLKYVEVPRDAAATTSYPGTAGVANMYDLAGIVAFWPPHHLHSPLMLSADRTPLRVAAAVSSH